MDNTKTIYLLRHGETEWSKSGKHTGLTDIPLTQNGEKQAIALGDRLSSINFDHVFCSPLIRAKETCRLANQLDKAIITPDLLEWNYGDYEGVTSKDIAKKDPNWNLFINGSPNGESLEDIKKRYQHLADILKPLSGNIALFSSGHFTRSFTVLYLNLALQEGLHFPLSTGSVSILGQNHGYPALNLWNDTSHIK